MTLRIGDRVKVEFEGKVTEIGGGRIAIQADESPGYWNYVLPEHLTKIEPPLPTEPGFYVGEGWTGKYPDLYYALTPEGEWFLHGEHGWSTQPAPVSEPRQADLPLIPYSERFG